jgi:tetratricopeptide (TPR) repeat protein
MKIFKRKAIFKVESEQLNPEEIAEPNTAKEFLNRGMVFYARKQYSEAESDMLKAISLDRNYIDAHYSLGMIHKAQDKKEEATQAFQQTLKLLDQEKNEKNSTIDMLKRLAKGHINEITLGDWDLEKEVWKRSA